MLESKVRDLRILISAFSCTPGKGSEPGVGWNVATQLAKYCQVWVLTRSRNRPAVEAELKLHPRDTLHFLYFEIPFLSAYAAGKTIITQVYYYLWHLVIYFAVARHYNRRIHFDLCHHITWSRYWMPNLISLLPIPFIWGPLGGGDSTPRHFWSGLGWRGRWHERFRNFVRWLAEHDPFLRMTAKKAVIGLSVTQATSSRLSILGVKRVEFSPHHVGINQTEFDYLSTLQHPESVGIRFISLGRMLPWKGLHLGLQAFALAQLKDAEFFLVGDGPDRRRLENLAQRLGILASVKFHEGLSRDKAWQLLEQCHVLIHPCLRGLTTTACLEAMAAGRPVISLNIGHDKHPVFSEQTGFRVDARSSDQAINCMAKAMVTLAQNSSLRDRMGKAARELVASYYLWDGNGHFLCDYYAKCIDKFESASRAVSSLSNPMEDAR
jgi:glycosyltransferase involved in cell wall biosynthesis